MRPSKTLARIRNRQMVRMCNLGHYIPAFVKQAAHYGFDCIWLDLEHRNFTDREVQALLAYSHLHNIDIMVRTPTREKTKLYRYLEDGAAGLMVPLVNTAAEARQLVDAVKFPPLGERGLDGAGWMETSIYATPQSLFARPTARRSWSCRLRLRRPSATSMRSQLCRRRCAVCRTWRSGSATASGSESGNAGGSLCADSCGLPASWQGLGTPVGTIEAMKHRRAQGGQLLAHGGEFLAMMRVLQESIANFEATEREIP